MAYYTLLYKYIISKKYIIKVYYQIRISVRDLLVLVACPPRHKFVHPPELLLLLLLIQAIRRMELRYPSMAQYTCPFNKFVKQAQ